MANAIERWFENRSLSPFRELSRLEENFNKLFNEMSAIRGKEGLEDYTFSPSCDISESDSSYIMKFDMPGVSKDQLKVEVANDTVTVQAERREEKRHDSKAKHLSEVCYGNYMRSFSLPGSVDEKKVDAKLENGVLTVTIPKTETLKAKQIPIH